MADDDRVAAYLAEVREDIRKQDDLVSRMAVASVGVPEFNAAQDRLAHHAPRLLAAVEAVQGKHREFEGRCTHCWQFCTCVEDSQDGTTGEAVYKAAYDGWDLCPHGNEPWPCPTYQAISRALLGEGEADD